MSNDRNVERKHAEWLALIEISGPFLSMPVLLRYFPQGLDAPSDEKLVRHRTSQAYEEWLDNQEGSHAEPAIHTQWLRFVLAEILELQADYILEGQQIPPALSYESKAHGETIRPSLVIRSPHQAQPRLLIQLYDNRQDLLKALPDRHWKATPAARMMELLRQTGIRLGLITNGRQWMLIDAPANETTGNYSWDASLWSEEPLTLRAFRSLLGMDRFFNAPDDETLEAMLTESALKQQDVTTQLGDQVLSAVETLVQALDALDKEDKLQKRGKGLPSLLADVSEREIYESALTLMMRLVFLLSAEERKLLLLDEQLYDDNYAISTLLQQLREQEAQQGEGVMSYRCDAWSRLLALFRLVYGGVEHVNLRLRAYGGRLFDPDRYPFLEGRASGTSWLSTPAQPLKIDNRTVLHLLSALQYLQVRAGGNSEPRRLSFRGLDIEQIGHIYEGLLDHTAKRAETAILGLLGKSDSEPEATLDELEFAASKGQAVLLDFLCVRTGRSQMTLQKALALTLDKQEERSRLMRACDNQQTLFDSILPFVGLIRKDTFKRYTIVAPQSVYVTKGTDRRSSGTHYTPRSLTEPMVQHALDPLVYIGPAEGWPEEQWTLRSAAEILDLKVCDMAMGSGAFLVQTCRYLSEKLVEAWENAERDLQGQVTAEGRLPRTQTAQTTPRGERARGYPSEEVISRDIEERLAIARRIISERCLYGVDKNPLAVEIAKLSLWLITLDKDKPFTFLDHNLRSGDSLLGADESQLNNNTMEKVTAEISQDSWIRNAMRNILPTIIQKRRQIAILPDFDIYIIQEKERLLKEANQALDILKLGGDMLIGLALNDTKRRTSLRDTFELEYFVLAKAYDEALHDRETDYGWAARNAAFVKMRAEVDELLSNRKPFHWPLEFPEVFIGKGDDAGFAAIIGNPPFQGGKKITGVLGTDYRNYLLKYLANGKTGNADLCAYFFLKDTKLIRRNGMCALIATNSIAQGDTREVGLDQIAASGWTIPRAISSRKWPGEASLEVAYIWLRNGTWNGSCILNDQITHSISSFLTQSGAVKGNPYNLISNTNQSFQGTLLLGTGFILEPEEAQALITKNPRNKDVLFPYLNGEELNSRSDQYPNRWVINFHEWPLEQAEQYNDCIQIIREKVLPQRAISSKFARKEWWLHHRTRPALYDSIATLKRVLIRARVSKTWGWSFFPLGWIYDEKIIAFAFDKYAEFAILQNTFHWEWSIQYGTTLRLDMSYTPTTNFETFPFPPNIDRLNSIGERYYAHRQAIMQERQEGLTKTYNRFHNSYEKARDIIELRALHREMDQAVAQAYGWDDVQLEHGFHETKQGLRYTISETARREILDRLLALNHQRHQEEVAAGLVDEQGKALKAKKSGSALQATALKNGKNGSGSGKSATIGKMPNDDLGQSMLF